MAEINHKKRNAECKSKIIRVLVVDDEEPIRDSLSELLIDAGDGWDRASKQDQGGVWALL